MGQPVVHFEIMGRDREGLQRYYSDLFGWEIEAGAPAHYGLVAREPNTNPEGVGIGGAVGGVPARKSTTWRGPDDHPGHVTFYVEVPDVEAALERAEQLGGARMLGPDRIHDGFEIGLFSDPEGHLLGLVTGAS